MPDNPTWIEPPQKNQGLGCFGKGCLASVALGLIAILLFGLGSYLFVSHGVVAKEPVTIPVEELPPAELADVQQRVKQFRSTPPTPLPTAAPSTPNETPSETPPPVSAPAAAERQLVVTVAEINGLIAANKKARGHAYVTLSGDTATVELSIPSDKIPGLPPGYLNGSFNITTNGPTPLTGLTVSRIETNGYSVPSGVLSLTYRGRSIMGYVLEAVAPYKVSTVEVQDGRVIAR